MTDSNPCIIEEGIVLTDVQKNSIMEGVQWVREWYLKRHEAGMFLDGADIGENVHEYDTAMKKLDNLCIIATNDMYGTLEKLIMDGKLHLKDEVIAKFDGDEEKAIGAMFLVTQRKKNDSRYAQTAGLHPNYIREDVLLLNVPLLEKEAENEDAPSLSSSVVHEVTHSLDLQLSEAMTDAILSSGALLEGVVPDEYLDNPAEVYARVKEFCKNLKLDPTKEVTTEDVQKMRKECEERRKKYEKEGGKGPKNWDHHLFDRYTDEKLTDLINYTAINDSLQFDNYGSFRNAAKVDLALGLHKISQANKNVTVAVIGKKSGTKAEITNGVKAHMIRKDQEHS